MLRIAARGARRASAEDLLARHTLDEKGLRTKYTGHYFFYLAMATNAAAGSGYLTLAMIFSSSAASVLS